jgi:hypothetical protein
MLNHTMLTVTLTASDTADRKGGGGSGVRATSEKWGVGHPSAARRYQPPHPLSYPSRKTFFAPKMNSRIPHIDKISMCGAGQGEGRITLNQPQKAWSGSVSVPKGLERTHFLIFFPKHNPPPHSPLHAFYVPNQGCTHPNPQSSPYTPLCSSNGNL